MIFEGMKTLCDATLLLKKKISYKTSFRKIFHLLTCILLLINSLSFVRILSLEYFLLHLKRIIAFKNLLCKFFAFN